MGYRLSKIVTRTGDDGTTSVEPRNRLPKDDPRIEAIGTIDELNSAIGLVLSAELPLNVKEVLTAIQHELFNLGGELCPPHHSKITAEKVTQLEKILNTWNATLPPLKEFILPGGNFPTAACHLARTICRRAERRLVTLYHQQNFNPEILRYINRLSDLLFVAARMIGSQGTQKEVLWKNL